MDGRHTPTVSAMDWHSPSGGELTITGHLRGYWASQYDIKVGGQYCLPIDPNPDEETEFTEDFVVAEHWDTEVVLRCTLPVLTPGRYNVSIVIQEAVVASNEYIDPDWCYYHAACDEISEADQGTDERISGFGAVSEKKNIVILLMLARTTFPHPVYCTLARAVHWLPLLMYPACICNYGVLTLVISLYTLACLDAMMQALWPTTRASSYEALASMGCPCTVAVSGKPAPWVCIQCKDEELPPQDFVRANVMLSGDSMESLQVYTLLITPQITSVTPATSGSHGGNLITIAGSGFGNGKSTKVASEPNTGMHITLGGAECSVKSRTETEVVCIAGAPALNAEGASALPFSGSAGVTVKRWLAFDGDWNSNPTTKEVQTDKLFVDFPDRFCSKGVWATKRTKTWYKKNGLGDVIYTGLTGDWKTGHSFEWNKLPKGRCCEAKKGSGCSTAECTSADQVNCVVPKSTNAAIEVSGWYGIGIF